MADLRVSDVTTRPEQPAGQPVPVTVALNNLETVALAWESGVCNTNGEYGHKATVRVEVRGPNSEMVANPSRDVCIPRNRAGQMGGPNLREEFNITLPEPGNYTVSAEVEARGSQGYDRSSPVSITAVEPSSTQSVSDDGSGAGSPAGFDFSGGSGGVQLPGGGMGDTANKGILVVGLLAVAWLASSASDTAEALG